MNLVIVRADDDQITMRRLKFLDAEPTADSFITWEPQNDDTIIINDGKETAEAKISADKKTIIGGPGILGHLAWITPEEAEVIRNRPKQSVAAPEVPYPLNPGKVGNLVIVSGPPGSGKSTILPECLLKQKSGSTMKATASCMDSIPICLLTKVRWRPDLKDLL